MRGTGIAKAIVMLLPVLAWGYLNIVDRRPFYIAEDDSEHTWYYTAKLLVEGSHPFDLHQPGLTTAYLAAASIAISQGQLDSPGRLLSWLRFLSALFVGIALSVVAHLIFRTSPPGVFALSLSTALAWPSFLLYFDYFDPNSAQLPLGLLTIVLFWGNLWTPTASLGRIGLCGLMLGVCLATKFTFVPLAVSMVGTMALYIVIGDGPILRRAWPLTTLVAVTVVCFVALAFPVIGEIPVMLLGLGGLQGEPGPLASGIQQWMAGWRGLWAANAAGTVLTLGAIAAFAIRLGRAVVAPSLSREQVLAGGFLLFTLMGLAYTMAAGEEDARGLRLAEPTALCIPLLVLQLLQTSSIARSRLPKYAIQAALLAAAVWVVAPGVLRRGQERHDFIKSRSEIIEKTRSRLLSLRLPGTRVAVWDGSAGSFLGEESFHFWGNYKYACDTFDEELLRTYPDFAFLRLREVSRIVAAESAGNALPDPRVPGSAFGRPGRLWRSVYPSIGCRRNDEIVAGEFSGLRISLVAFPTDEWNDGDNELEGSVSVGAFLALLSQRFGPTFARRELIAGIEWVLIGISAGSGERPSRSGSKPSEDDVSPIAELDSWI